MCSHVEHIIQSMTINCTSMYLLFDGKLNYNFSIYKKYEKKNLNGTLYMNIEWNIYGWGVNTYKSTQYSFIKLTIHGSTSTRLKFV